MLPTDGRPDRFRSPTLKVPSSKRILALLIIVILLVAGLMAATCPVVIIRLSGEEERNGLLHWPRMHGMSKAEHDYEKGIFRLYKLTEPPRPQSSYRMSKKVGMEGVFEIWAWHSIKPDGDGFCTDDTLFVDAYNQVMTNLCEKKATNKTPNESVP